MIILIITIFFFNSDVGSARNISVRIQFMCGEQEQHAMPVIFGKSSCPEFASDYHTAVTYHNKYIIIYSDIKILVTFIPIIIVIITLILIIIIII